MSFEAADLRGDHVKMRAELRLRGLPMIVGKNGKVVEEKP
jgi:hypothetical protein